MKLSHAWPPPWATDPPEAIRSAPIVNLRGFDPGAPVWLARLEHVLAISLETQLAAGHHSWMKDVTFVLVEKSGINALAYSERGYDLVVLQTGMFEAMQDKIELSIQNESFLARYLPTNNSPQSGAFSFLTAEGKPADQLNQRSLWALSFLSRAIDFILHHELAHLGREHHRRLAKHGAGLCIDEALAMSEGGIVGQTRWMLELDADIVAIDMMLVSMNAERPISEWGREQLEDEFFNILLTALLVCQLLDRDSYEMASYAGGCHPAPVVRAALLGRVLRYTFEKFDRVDPDGLLNLHDQAWWEASQVAKASGLRKGRWWGRDMNDVPDSLIDEIEAAYREFSAGLRNSVGTDP